MHWNYGHDKKLEKLEHLRSEDTPAASWLPKLLSHIGSQVKIRQSQSYKFKEFAKILKQTLHVTHLLKWLDKMCKCEMDPMSIVEDTERTRFCPQMDRRTDGQGETSIPPFQLCWSGGYKNMNHVIMTFELSFLVNFSTLAEVMACWLMANGLLSDGIKPFYMSYVWPNDNLTLRSKLQWNFHQNTITFIQETTF